MDRAQSIQHQDERAADRGPNSGSARLRPRGRAAVRRGSARGSRAGSGAAAERDPDDSRAERRRSASRTARSAADAGSRHARVDARCSRTACRPPIRAIKNPTPCSSLHDGPAIARARQLSAVGARVWLVRRADRSVLRRLQRRVPIREARRGSRAQARRDLRASGVYFLWAMFASHWNKPIDESIELYRQSIQYGLQSGDHLHAGYSAARRFSHLQFRGHAARRAARGRQRHDGAAAPDRRRANTEFVLPRLRFIDWLQGSRPHGNTLGSDERDEAQHAPRSFGARQPLVRVGLVHAARRCSATTAATSRRPTSSRHELAEALLPFSAGFVTRGEHAMFFSLAIDGSLSARRRREQRAVYDARARGQPRAAREMGRGLPRELSAHAAAGRGGVRAGRRRAHRSRRSLRPRDHAPRARRLREHRGARGRARGALLVRATTSRISPGCISTRRCTPTRSGARPARRRTCGRRTASRAPRSAAASVTAGSTTLGASAPSAATRSTSRRCSRRARRSPAKSCSSGCSRR